MRKIARLLGLVLLNLLLIMGLLELLLRLAVPVLPDSLAISARWVLTGKPFAEDWTPAWQQNRDHYYALRPNITNELQYGSPRVRFSLSTIELWEGGGIGFRTDPVNFRVDAVVVGDSFGFCFTERVDCWVDQLAHQTGLGMVNLSMPVTGTTSHLRILRDFGQPLAPPLVLWQFFGNDFNDDYGLAVFRKEIEALEAPPSSPTPSNLHEWLRRHSVAYAVLETALTGSFQGFDASESLFYKPYQVQFGAANEHELIFGSLYEQEAMDMNRPANQIGYDYSQQAFIEAQTLVESWGGELVIVIMPTREEVYSDLTLPYIGTAGLAKLQSARTAMIALCEDLALVCYEPFEAFQTAARQGEALYHVDDMHLNPHGNQLLAELLAAWLEENRNFE